MTNRSRRLHKPLVQNSDAKSAAPTSTEAETSAPTTDEQKSDAAQGTASVRPAHAFQSIALSDANGGPMMRLLRSNKYQQMQMQFDEKPDEKYRQMLTQQGWKWRSEEKVWSKQLDKENRWCIHADAEKLFNEIGSAIRADKGLSPILEFGR